MQGGLQEYTGLGWSLTGERVWQQYDGSRDKKNPSAG